MSNANKSSSKRPLFSASRSSNASRKMMLLAVQTATAAWKDPKKRNTDEIAEKLKAEFDEQHGTEWHCVVVRGQCYMDVRYRKGSCIIVTGPVKIIVWKAAPAAFGVSPGSSENATDATSDENGDSGPGAAAGGAGTDTAKDKAAKSKEKYKIIASDMTPAMAAYAVEIVTRAALHPESSSTPEVFLRKIKEQMTDKYSQVWHVVATTLDKGMGFDDLGSSVVYEDECFMDISITGFRVCFFKYEQAAGPIEFDMHSVSLTVLAVAVLLFMGYHLHHFVCAEMKAKPELEQDPAGITNCDINQDYLLKATMVCGMLGAVLRFVSKMQKRAEKRLKLQ